MPKESEHCGNPGGGKDMNGRYFIFILVVPVLTVLLAGGCAGPVDEDATDYSEFESVWQYLKVYSIYQDRIPEDPFVYPSPRSLMYAIADTLYGNHYTDYFSYMSSITTTAGTFAFRTVSDDELVVFDSLTDSTARIGISSFAGEPFLLFKAFLPRLQRFPNLIVDLRMNGGGDIDQADSVVNAFLPVGTAYVQARQREYLPEKRTAHTRDWHPWHTTDVARRELRGKKIVILQDGGTASASEIVIAALKDCAGATLVGERTYGKGIGQIRLVRRDRGILQITFLQLKGLDDGKIGDYHHKGIAADIAASGSDDDWLLTAVRINEPHVTSLPALRKRTARTAAHTPAGYRVVYEE